MGKGGQFRTEKRNPFIFAIHKLNLIKRNREKQSLSHLSLLFFFLTSAKQVQVSGTCVIVFVIVDVCCVVVGPASWWNFSPFADRYDALQSRSSSNVYLSLNRLKEAHMPTLDGNLYYLISSHIISIYTFIIYIHQPYIFLYLSAQPIGCSEHYLSLFVCRDSVERVN